MAKVLRDYQQAAKDAVLKNLNNGIKRNMIVMATGCGKTVTAVKTISEFKRKLWITHTSELIDQSGSALLQELAPGINIQTMIDTHGGLTEYLCAARANDLFSSMADNEIIKSIGIIKAEAFHIESDILIASAQTLHRRLDRMKPDMFDVVVCDEAHLFLAKTFIKSVNYFDPKLLLTLTATPDRADGADLSEIADSIAYQYGISDGISDGYLAELDAVQIRTSLNLDEVRTTAGEFNQKDLKQQVDTPERNKLIVDSYKKYAEGKQNLIFCVDVEHAQNVCQAFKDSGYTSEYIVGDIELTPDRKVVINRFRKGETKHLSNCMVLTAGYDNPYIGCLTLACPTKSLTKFTQCVGRGTRTLPGVIDGLNTPEERIRAIKASNKPACIILDIVDVSSRHKIVNTWTLDKDKPIEKRVFVTAEKKEKMIEARQKREFEARTKKDTRVQLIPLPKIKLSTSLKMKDPATPAQIDKLRSLGFDIENQNYTKGDANKLISNDEAPSNWVYVIKSWGYNVSNGVTRAEASSIFAMHDKKKQEEQKNKINIDGL